MFAMGSNVQEKELDIIIIQEETEEMQNLEKIIVEPESLTLTAGKYKRWLEVGIHAFIVLASLSVATILGKLYYDKGGRSTWLASLTQTIGFPILLIPMIISNNNKIKTPKLEGIVSHNDVDAKSPSKMVLLSIYAFLGFLLGVGCVLYSKGLLHLPTSTFSLISASQLGFNVLFSLFMRLQKITFFVSNSIFLLTISSVLLALQPDHDSSSKTESSSQLKHHYVLGFVFTLIASAGFGLLLATTELMFRKFLKKNSLKENMDVIICQSFFATCLILIGLFASGEWRKLKAEMQDFELGEVSYVMILFWIILCWQLYSYSLLGLIMKVSAVFANVITSLGAPLIQILSVIIFHDKMSGVKAISIVLAIWGFSSYAYQQYLDEQKHKAELSICNGASEEFVGEGDFTCKENSTVIN
ncbi:PREDICTED: probable purine permease 10 isoform X1 [Nicotiana attenuata]|uniref:Probable purine permease n=1 Tax=Nicotiana attenuata TaxID=49451 RepID=A0A314LC63_NICAT|nr:PREDICTED: probable purine permease 10 isoform X1 [Nicotiana attenuata]OIT39341.1 putative purine permease 9 [Nicotiana attenuata]